ncbi:SDR family oxidoreductase [Haliangium ochraceum]|uniref:Short-chain dehydrogenase/reductase SDR n=1 Tax=Haliangium ochraceum (strain DSM 14365 / JCM 11303 / SMP-2) TaxID=502025 RepID=D0LUU4_HALO1|nr:SDR family oxidoreductase [Haliangium ochraceum]ACY13984.1 short-chain dehydrogenase/reductase SDR [Haliangium ochraceum DSM 14365]
MSDTHSTKIALITGASSGTGLSTAALFAKAGHTVIATLRDPGRADALRERAQRDGVALDIRQLDVCDPDSIAACVQGVIADYGRVDILVNNAGAGYLGTLEQTPFADLQRTMDVNYYGVVRMTQALLPHMRAARSGRIVSVTSIGGVVGQPFNDAYCAAKFAVEGLMESLAPVAGRFGVQVSLVEPGAVATDFIANMRASIEARQSGEDPYGPLLAAYMARVQANYSAGQTPDELARVVLEAATAARPHLHYPSSEQVRERIRVKHDISGDRLMELTAGMFDPRAQ